MRVFSNLEAIPELLRPAVTVGSYDGVHGGHRRLLEATIEAARLRQGESVVVTFEPHPRVALGRTEGLQLLTTLGEKMLLMERYGIDNLVVVPFDRAFSRMSYLDFVREVLVGRIGMEHLVVGYNHRFGHDREGNGRQLEAAGYAVTEVAECRIGDAKVSSTELRRIIAAGDMAQAARMLTHPYLIIGSSDGAGRIVVDEPLKLLPQPGRYRVTVDGRAAALTIDGSRILRAEPAPAAGKATIEFES